jgi:geranylgeranyl diphosphate synthase type II
LAGGASDNELHNISEFAFALGMGFQIKDDLLDHSDKDQDFKSYVKILGLENTQHELQNYSDQAMKALEGFGAKAQILRELIIYNQQRAE